MTDTKTSPGRSWSGVLVKEMAVGELSEKQETKVWKWHLLASGIVFISHRMETKSAKYPDAPLRRGLFLLHVMALGSPEETFWDLSGALLLCCLL